MASAITQEIKDWLVQKIQEKITQKVTQAVRNKISSGEFILKDPRGWGRTIGKEVGGLIGAELGAGAVALFTIVFPLMKPIAIPIGAFIGTEMGEQIGCEIGERVECKFYGRQMYDTPPKSREDQEDQEFLEATGTKYFSFIFHGPFPEPTSPARHPTFMITTHDVPNQHHHVVFMSTPKNKDRKLNIISDFFGISEEQKAEARRTLIELYDPRGYIIYLSRFGHNKIDFFGGPLRMVSAMVDSTKRMGWDTNNISCTTVDMKRN